MELNTLLLVEKTLFNFWLKEKSIFIAFLIFALCTIILPFTSLPTFLNTYSNFLTVCLLIMFYVLDNKLNENNFYSVFSIRSFWQHFIKVNLIYILFSILSLIRFIIFDLHNKPNFLNDIIVYITSYLYACQLEFPRSFILKIISFMIGNLIIVLIGFGGKIYLIITMIITGIFYIYKLKNEQNY